MARRTNQEPESQANTEIVARIGDKSLLVAAGICLVLLAGPGAAFPDEVRADTGGARFVPPPPPPAFAAIVGGKAIAPRGAPRRVRHVIVAANRLIHKPYLWCGGHDAFASGLDTAYDCSGAVSYALYGGRFLGGPRASGDLMRWGSRGRGRWITVYANRGHTYIVVAGLRFDTSMHDPDAPGPKTGPRWSRTLRRSASLVARHPRRY
jgi:hypothetical protein